METPPFEYGDIVRLKTGKSQIKVLEVAYFSCENKENTPRKTKRYTRPRKGWFIRFAYVSSLRFEMENSYDRTWREADDFVFFDPQQKKEETMTQPVIPLYETKEGEFGVKCGENSEGKWILEIKGSNGKIQAFDKADLTEVVPYTVELMRLNVEHNIKPERRHYRAEKGAVEKGDILMQLTTSAMWRVVDIDTKCRSAQVSKNGFARIQTEKVTVGKE